MAFPLIFTNQQETDILDYLTTTRWSIRNKVIFLLNLKAGLSAEQIANLKWHMVLRGQEIADVIAIPYQKPIHSQLYNALNELKINTSWIFLKDNVIKTERQDHTSVEALSNTFADWYRNMGLGKGYNHKTGRHTFNKATRLRLGFTK